MQRNTWARTRADRPSSGLLGQAGAHGIEPVERGFLGDLLDLSGEGEPPLRVGRSGSRTPPSRKHYGERPVRGAERAAPTRCRPTADADADRAPACPGGQSRRSLRTAARAQGRHSRARGRRPRARGDEQRMTRDSGDTRAPRIKAAGSTAEGERVGRGRLQRRSTGRRAASRGSRAKATMPRWTRAGRSGSARRPQSTMGAPRGRSRRRRAGTRARRVTGASPPAPHVPGQFRQAEGLVEPRQICATVFSLRIACREDQRQLRPNFVDAMG